MVFLCYVAGEVVVGVLGIMKGGGKVRAGVIGTRCEVVSGVSAEQRVADEIERRYGPPTGSDALTTTQGITSPGSSGT